MPYLLIAINGNVVPDQIIVDGSLDIGRDPHCDIRITDDQTSRYHARVRAVDGGIMVEDNNSSNGTTVGGEKIHHRELHDGQQFGCGRATFLVVDQDKAGADTRIPTDGRGILDTTGEAKPRTWRSGDDPKHLAVVHGLCRKLAGFSSLADRARITCEAAQKMFSAERTAIIDRGAHLAGSMSQRLAQRLAAGDQVRALELGKDLLGQTIAAEMVGSALSIPISKRAHLLAARGLDDDPFGNRDLSLAALLAAEVTPYFKGKTDDEAISRLIGEAPAMQELRRRVKRMAATDATILITGESGTGKELVARAIHSISGRRAAPFVAVNCGAIAASLVESELFGHEKGAFTGADRAHKGRIRAADGGTLFLDEIGELPMDLQPKLLRTLQEGCIEPVGSTESKKVNIRVLAATNRDLNAEVEAGRFREDLFYRLDVLRVHTPGLRDHADDIPSIAQALLKDLEHETGMRAPRLSTEAEEVLCGQKWPGNVRQLRNTLHRAMVLADDYITPNHLELDLKPRRRGTHEAQTFPTLAEVEARHVALALKHTRGNKSQAARLLGISRPTLMRKIDEYGLRKVT